jgi:hypothetical protein
MMTASGSPQDVFARHGQWLRAGDLEEIASDRSADGTDKPASSAGHNQVETVSYANEPG